MRKIFLLLTIVLLTPNIYSQSIQSGSKDIDVAKSINYILDITSNKYSHYILTNDQVNTIIKEKGSSVRFVDFHIHTTFKNYYNHIKSPTWLNSNLPKEYISRLNWSGVNKRAHNRFNHFKSYRQADFGILEASGASMLATAISPIEKRMVSKEPALLGLSIRFINKWLVSKLSAKRLRTLYHRDNSSFDEFNGELKFLLAQQSFSPYNSGYEIGVVSTKKELIENFKKGKTSLIISLEGAHNLHGKSLAKNQTLTKKPLRREFNDEEFFQCLQNIDSLKNLPYRIFFVTLGHFAWNGISGSAKSLDMDKFRWLLLSKSRGEKFRKKVFYKPGDGIIGYVYNLKIDKDTSNSKELKEHRKEAKAQEKMKRPKICDCARDSVETKNLGWHTIKKLLDTTNGKPPIYIDVKHMDIKARFQYYHFLDTSAYENIPIIASHVGASGEDSALAEYSGLCPVYDVYEEVANTKNWYKLQNGFGCIFPDKNRQETIGWFYPWSINLCDEEIKRIYKSDGIIGVALEERVIGTGRPNYKRDNDSFKRYIKSKGFVNEDSIQVFCDMQPLFRNIFHFVEKSERNDKSAWNHLSLGSDFDGIARPVPYCRTAAEIPKLHKLLITFLPHFAEYSNKSTLMYGLSSKEISDKIVFENGERFILKYF